VIQDQGARVTTRAPDDRGRQALSPDDDTAQRVPAELLAGSDRAERFQTFHEQNPHIYGLLVHYCREWAETSGRKKFGIRAPWERMRWQLAVRTMRPEGEPKLNDHMTSFYARLIAAQEPDLRDLLETRRSIADKWIGGVR